MRQARNYVKKGLQRRCFSVKFAKFLKISILKNIYKRLLLDLTEENSGTRACKIL